MKLLDSAETIIIVTGSSPGATSKDLPVALELQETINQRGAGSVYRRAVVLRDERYAESPTLHAHPIIAIGGPGTNGITGQYTQILPMVWMIEDRSFVQMATHEDGKHAALWGTDAAGTRGAVEAFVREGLLDALLERVWRFRGADLS